jgi:hypothetical protein
MAQTGPLDTAVIFSHRNFADQNLLTHFLKNISSSAASCRSAILPRTARWFSVAAE